jgi:hypothetical protein
MNHRLLLSAIVCIFIFAATAMSTVPSLINFQGTMADSNGNPLNSTISLMRFSIYPDSVGGSVLWSENHSNVQVSDGLFRVILGSSTAFPSTLFNGSRRWLAIRALPDMQDMTPRVPMVTVPYAYRTKEADHSTFADTAGWADFAVPLHVTGDTASAAIIWGTNTTGTGYAIEGENSNTHTYGFLAGNYYGAFGYNQNLNRGFLGHNDYGVWGTHGFSGNNGYLGSSSYGVYGEHNGGTTGFLGGAWGGAFGSSPTGQYWGYLGFVSAGTYGYSTAGPWGLLGNDSIGVFGNSTVSSGGGVYGRYGTSGPTGWLGRSSYGVYGRHNNGHYGYIGGSTVGIYGRNSNNNYGYIGGGSYGVYGNSSSTSGYGGYFYASGSGGTGIYARGGSGGRAATLRGNVVIQGLTSGSTVLELGEGLDYAEGFDVAQQDDVEPGTVLIIDPANPGKLAVSNTAYDSKVAGIVAGAKGLGSGVRLGTGQFNHNVALAGRVYCNVDASDGTIEPGDLLTTSAMPGYAMKASDYSRAQGAILGKAMERLEKGQKSQILVLVTLQ